MQTKLIAGIACTEIVKHINHANTDHVGIIFTFNNRICQGIIPKPIWEAALLAPQQTQTGPNEDKKTS